MIRRSPFARTAAARASNKYGAVRTVCALGHHHASKLESAWCAALGLLEKGGTIRNLRQQVTHTMYLQAAPDLQSGTRGTWLLGWCSCLGLKGAPAPSGFERFRAIRPDYEFEERTSSAPDWFTVTADAKGAGDDAQALAYKVFELIHARPVRLYKRLP